MKTLIVLTRSGTVLVADGNAVEFKVGDTLLVPAAYEGVMRFDDETQYLTVTV